LAYDIAIDVRKIEDFGIGTYIRNLVANLAAIDGQNRYVLLARTARDFPLDLPENFQLVQERAPVYSLREMGTLSWRLLRLDVDLYHSTHYILPALLPCPVVATIHDIIHLLYPEYLPSRLAFFYAQRMIRRTLLRADRVIAVSKNTKADLVRYFEVDGGKIQVIYNGVEDAFRARLAEAEVTRWLRSLEVERPYVLFVGNAAKPHKNLDHVVKAFARARKRKPFEARLVCVGERGPATFKIEQRAAQLGIADRVVMLGHVAAEALPALYQGATLFVYPTLYEGFGLPVAEAMASGVPVITSNTSALKEVAEGYAHLVDPLDVDALADAIAHCMTDPEHRASLARLGIRRAEEFQWRRTAQRTLEVYESAIAAARGRRLWGGRSTAPAAEAAGRREGGRR
jgi:glycosyltransferase involved in cell wall biosynthesis